MVSWFSLPVHYGMKGKKKHGITIFFLLPHAVVNVSRAM